MRIHALSRPYAAVELFEKEPSKRCPLSAHAAHTSARYDQLHPFDHDALCNCTPMHGRIDVSPVFKPKVPSLQPNNLQLCAFPEKPRPTRRPQLIYTDAANPESSALLHASSSHLRHRRAGIQRHHQEFECSNQLIEPSTHSEVVQNVAVCTAGALDDTTAYAVM